MGNLDQDLPLHQVSDEELGQRIRAARCAAGLTQAQVAHGTLSVFYLSRIESGTKRPGLKTLYKLADKLGVSIRELVSGVGRDRTLEIQLTIDHAELALAGGEIDRAYVDAIDAEAAAASLQATDLVLRARYIRALVEEARGELDRAIITLEDVVAADPGGGLAAPVGIALSRCYRESGEFARAIDSGEGVLARLAERGEDGTPDCIRLSMTVSAAYADQGDLGHAQRLAQRAIDAAQRVDSPEALAAAYWNSSVYEEERGNLPEAITQANKALVLLESKDSNRNVARLRTMLGGMLLCADEPDLDLAQGLLDVAARELAWTAASPVDIGENLLARATAAALTGEHDQALELLAQIPEAALAQAPFVAAQHLSLRANITAATGDLEGALPLWDQARATLESIGDERHVAQLWCELGHAYRQAGQLELAVTAFERAATASGASQLRLPVIERRLGDRTVR